MLFFGVQKERVKPTKAVTVLIRSLQVMPMIVWNILATILLICSLSFCAIKEDHSNIQCIQNDTYPGRLPTSVLPTHYSIHLTLPGPDTSNATTFKGSVQIQLEVVVDTTCIVFNAKNLDFSVKDVVFIANKQAFSVQQLQFDSKNSIAIALFSQPFSAGTKGTLMISYSGFIQQDEARGLFLSNNSFSPSDMKTFPKHVQNIKNNNQFSNFFKRFNSIKSHFMDYNELPVQNTISSSQKQNLKMLATQFEFSDARAAFPSWDEPDFKSTFEYRITVPNGQNLTVLTNTDEKSRQTSKNTITFEFHKTKIVMSTYLVAFAVGQFDFLEKKEGDVRFRIFTPPGNSQYATLAMNVSIKAVSFFSKMFNFSYANLNRKMDQISVPAIQYDAMENQGNLF